MFGEYVDFGAEFWVKDRRRSGREVDVLRGQNIPSNSKTIDRTVGSSGVVSHKSTDLRCKSYQSPGAVYRIGMSFVSALEEYSGEVRRNRKIQATYFLHWIVEQAEASRVLEWFVPSLGVRADQIAALMRVVVDGRSRGIDVRIFRA